MNAAGLVQMFEWVTQLTDEQRAVLRPVLDRLLEQAKSGAASTWHDGPRRAYVVSVELGADTLEDLVWNLKHIAHEIEHEGGTGTVSGSPSAGYTYRLTHDPTMTHDRYFQEVDRYLKWKKGDA